MPSRAAQRPPTATLSTSTYGVAKGPAHASSGRFQARHPKDRAVVDERVERVVRPVEAVGAKPVARLVHRRRVGASVGVHGGEHAPRFAAEMLQHVDLPGGRAGTAGGPVVHEPVEQQPRRAPAAGEARRAGHHLDAPVGEGKPAARGQPRRRDRPGFVFVRLDHEVALVDACVVRVRRVGLQLVVAPAACAHVKRPLGRIGPPVGVERVLPHQPVGCGRRACRQRRYRRRRAS